MDKRDDPIFCKLVDLAPSLKERIIILFIYAAIGFALGFVGVQVYLHHGR